MIYIECSAKEQKRIPTDGKVQIIELSCSTKQPTWFFTSIVTKVQSGPYCMAHAALLISPRDTYVLEAAEVDPNTTRTEQD